MAYYDLRIPATVSQGVQNYLLAHQEALEGFSERLRRVIEREDGRGKKQAFARKIGLKPQQLSRYLHGRIPYAPYSARHCQGGPGQSRLVIDGPEGAWWGNGSHVSCLSVGLTTLRRVTTPS